MILESAFYGTLERYLDLHGAALARATLYRIRRSVLSLVGFLLSHFPEVDSFAKLKRAPHVESWLRWLPEAGPPTGQTLQRCIRAVSDFLADIRARGWPDAPPGVLLGDDDLPEVRPRRRPRLFNGRFPDPDNRFHQTLQRYLDIRGATLRPASLKHYRVAVLSLIAFLETEFPEVDSLAKLRRSPHIEDWLRLLARVRPPFSNGSRRDYIRSVRRFFQDLNEWEWPGSPPPGLIRPADFPPPQRYLPKPLPPEVDAQLMEALAKDGELVSLGLILARRTGLRVGELSRLDLECMTKDRRGRYSIRVPLGKLHSEREIPVDPETASLLNAIREQRGQHPPTSDPETGKPAEFLLCDHNGRLLKRHLFGQQLKRVARKAGITQNVHPHRLRHTYATELLRNGVSLPGVMKLLGHNSLKMTLRYVAVTNEDLGRNYLEAIDRARHHYGRLKPLGETGDDEQRDPIEGIGACFDHLVARIQALRFDDLDPRRRKQLQRLVERLRRAQHDLPEIMA